MNVFTGWEGLQSRFILQANCEICWGAYDPLGVHCFFCGKIFVSSQAPIFVYSSHGKHFQCTTKSLWNMDFLVWKLFSRYGLLSKLNICHHLLHLFWFVVCKVERNEYSFNSFVVWQKWISYNLCLQVNLQVQALHACSICGHSPSKDKPTEVEFHWCIWSTWTAFSFCVFIQLSTCLYLWNLGLSNIGMQIINFVKIYFWAYI